MPEERERGQGRERGRGPERRGDRNREEDQEALARRISQFLRGGAAGSAGEIEALRQQLHEAAEFLASRSDEEDAGFIQILHEATAAEFEDLNLPDSVVARIARWGQAMGLVLAGHAQRVQGFGGEVPSLPPDVYHIVNPRLIDVHMDETGRDLHLRFEDGRIGALVILVDGGMRRDTIIEAIEQAAREARTLVRTSYTPAAALPPLLETVVEADEVEAFADEETGDAGITFLLDEGEMAPVLICHLTIAQMAELRDAVRDAEPKEH